MINKIKSILDEFRSNNRQNKEAIKEVLLQLTELNKVNQEILWAHIYHDSVRGKKFLVNESYNIGRWAGNYTFFYVLNRILGDYKPKKILELGLGESTKFISAYLDNLLINTTHTVVEHDKNWIEFFNSNFILTERTTIVHCLLKQIIIESNITNSYDGFTEIINDNYDLIVIDGPFGSDRFSRYDVVSIVKMYTNDKSFIILFDDTDRRGEEDTVNNIIKILINNKVEHHIRTYSGNKKVTLICSENNKMYISL